jgi:hypothetical protein
VQKSHRCGKPILVGARLSKGANRRTGFHVKPLICGGLRPTTFKHARVSLEMDPYLKIARQLDGLSLAEAFRKIVLDDPHIATSAIPVLKLDNFHETVFRNGQFPGLYVDFHWPLDISAHSLAYAFVKPKPKVPDAVLRLSEAMARRIQDLREAFSTGAVVTQGTFVTTGEIRGIDRRQWSRHGLFIDTQNSDLLVTENRRPALKWSGVTCEAQLPTLESKPENPEQPATRPVAKGPTAQRESVYEAVKALWPQGQPAGVTVQQRDRIINDWQRKNGRSVTNPRTIRRHLKGD